MCEMCSSFFKSAASLARHKKAKHGSYNKYICTECGATSKTQKEHNNHKRKHATFHTGEYFTKIRGPPPSGKKSTCWQKLSEKS